MIYLARQPPATVLTLQQIAEASDLPVGFLAKTFQKLVRHGLVESFRGRRRGYCLARDASKVPLRELLEAIEGPDLTQRCVFWGRRCGDSNPCLLHTGWREIKPHLTEFLESMTLAMVARSEGNGNSSEAEPREVRPRRV